MCQSNAINQGLTTATVVTWDAETHQSAAYDLYAFLLFISISCRDSSTAGTCAVAVPFGPALILSVAGVVDDPPDATDPVAELESPRCCCPSRGRDACSSNGE